MNPRITVRPLGVAQLAGQLDGWVDFNCFDVFCTSAQSGRDVVAGSGANDRDICQRGLGFIRKVVVSASRAPSRTLWVREIKNALIVMACGADERQARITVARNLQ